MTDPPPAALDEYRQLREEKAADWRLITQTTVATLATTAAIAAAGLSIHSRALVVLAPVPFYLGVAYMIQAAWLQTRMIAFLAAAAPAGALNYEKYVLETRSKNEIQSQSPWWATSWVWWTAVAGALGLLLAGFPYLVRLEDLDGFDHSCALPYTLVGLLLLSAFLVGVKYLHAKVVAARRLWDEIWKEVYVPDADSSSQAPTPPAR